MQVSMLRQKISDEIKNNQTDLMTWLASHCQLSKEGASQLIQYIHEGEQILGEVPTQKRIIAERFFDESGGMHLVIHAPFGARVNKAWGLALRKCFCRNFDLELQASATDNGIDIALTEQHSFPLEDVFHYLNPNSLLHVLTQAALQSPIFTTRWRWVLCRSLSLARFYHGKKTPPHIMRMLSEDLLGAIFPEQQACQDNRVGDIELPEHPLVEETMKDVLNEALDIQGLYGILKAIQKKDIICHAIDTPTPSVFSHEILNANPYAFLDDAPLEERRTRAVMMRQVLPQYLLKDIGKLDTKTIDEIKKQVWPDIRSPDELHDFLQTIIALPIHHKGDFSIHKHWLTFFRELEQMKRAGQATVDKQEFWYASEKATSFATIYPDAVYPHSLVSFETNPPLSQEDAIHTLAREWFAFSGPMDIKRLSSWLKIDLGLAQYSILRLESSGLLLRGQFTSSEQEWCNRRLLARIHRLTLSRLKKEIKPVCTELFMQWLTVWQHLSKRSQLKGELVF